jgi:hypothetical protein
VAIGDALGRHLVSLLDGTRDREALLLEMKRFIASETAATAACRDASAGLSPDDLALRTQLERSLQGLAGLGLFRRE